MVRPLLSIGESSVADFANAIAEFERLRAERSAQAQLETEHLKQAVLRPLLEANIARVEVRFDGYGDSGAVEDLTCFDVEGVTVACPDVAIAPFDFEITREPIGDAPMLLAAAFDSLTHLAFERFHPGWEINEGACGTLIIDAAAASFVLDCSLRFTSTEDHSTEL